MENIKSRIINCIITPIPKALKVGLWLILITVPIAFLVFMLKYTGAMVIIADFFEPIFSLMGLPGESALVFITSCLLNIYSCIAVIGTLNLNGHEITVLALMCLISHNLPVECAVQRKTGTKAMPILLIRLLSSFVAGAILNIMLPKNISSNFNGVSSSTSNLTGSFYSDFIIWFSGISMLCIQILVLISLLMVLQKFLEEFKITNILSELLKYPLKILGIPPKAAFLWIIANTLGLAYGAGILIDHSERGSLSRRELDSLNYHIAVSHSLLEDTLLFVAIGVSAWWITIPRLAIAGIVVWLTNLIYLFSKKYKISDTTIKESA